jgi:hypothetical protein
MEEFERIPGLAGGTLILPFFSLLKQSEPIPEAYDVEWWGPHYIPRSGHWFPTHFKLYQGVLYGTLKMDWSLATGQWYTETGEFFRDRSSGYWSLETADPEFWDRALPELTRRLQTALKNPVAYNRRVLRLLPLEVRTGTLLRRLSWPRGQRAPLSPALARRLENACRSGALGRSWRKMSVDDYLRTAALAYDAGIKELRGLPPRDKYERKADSRHGGLLKIASTDAQAFYEWYTSRSWLGAHPWEIVFGHPHGILLSPLLDSRGRWRFHLSVDSLGWYATAARMAIALGEGGVPFELQRRDEVAAALRGQDFIPVGPRFGQLSLSELRTIRPDAEAHIRWDPIPEIRPISKDQQHRLEYILRTGSPAGWK